MDATIRTYDRRVTQSVRRALATGARTLPAVLEHTPGVFPLTVVRKLQELGAEIPIARSIRRLGAPISKHRQAPFVLPHPLDYDWRFGREALTTLSQLIRATQPIPAPVYCFGCPTVARFLRDETWHTGVHLYDCNGDLHERGRTAWQAGVPIALTLPRGSVVVDPPWYLRHFRHFLWTIQRSCAPGTDVFLAGPPLGTRPGVAAEMARVVRWARRLGFVVLFHRPHVLPYVAPLFELNTLAAHGAPDVSLTWRRADLWHLQLTAKPVVPRPKEELHEGQWTERRFGAVRIRIRLDGTGRGCGNLRPLGTDGFLDSVSSRDPRRREANVVTSGGRFLACSNPRELLRTSSFVSDALIPKERRFPLRPAKWDLPHLVAVEQMESAQYYDLVRKIDGV